jgi:hypothetical protein
MTKKGKKPVYEPPKAIDLSSFSANGQMGPTGVCKHGVAPFYNCVSGPDFLGTCDPTGGTPDTSECDPVGGYHLTPACDSGSSAATICVTGTGQQ